ncbi:mitochondrial import inner membrane translocase subunit Tim9-like [Panonychus citri]|uniref:mitochondrial import inner membrane translocase subunit Tim9-like n=1 Tax=Panonychus citri TaxID=50023 RepID=UPI0023077652|nr:mitochondrial import inner membrane translocase subunit Tim9-like [Panonychus citri]
MAMPPGSADFNSPSTQMRLFKEYMIDFNRLAEQCFNDCIFDFTQRKMTSKEEKCEDNCVQKYFKVNQRLSKRFYEIHAVENPLDKATA